MPQPFLKLAGKLILAPMHDITNIALRRRVSMSGDPYVHRSRSSEYDSDRWVSVIG